jgi:hypothetical protein
VLPLMVSREFAVKMPRRLLTVMDRVLESKRWPLLMKVDFASLFNWTVRIAFNVQ